MSRLNDELCPRTEMLRAYCAHCRPAKPPEQVTVVTFFNAKFGSHCDFCEEPIAKDDLIGYDANREIACRRHFRGWSI